MTREEFPRTRVIKHARLRDVRERIGHEGSRSCRSGCCAPRVPWERDGAGPISADTSVTVHFAQIVEHATGSSWLMTRPTASAGWI